MSLISLILLITSFSCNKSANMTNNLSVKVQLLDVHPWSYHLTPDLRSTPCSVIKDLKYALRSGVFASSNQSWQHDHFTKNLVTKLILLLINPSSNLPLKSPQNCILIQILGVCSNPSDSS